MAVIYDVVATTGTYEKDGKTMYRNQTIGRVIETSKGLSLKLDQIPLADGGWNGWASLFTPMTDEQKEAKRNGVFPKKQSNDGFPSDDIQF
jgi:hypothetical protein